MLLNPLLIKYWYIKQTRYVLSSSFTYQVIVHSGIYYLYNLFHNFVVILLIYTPSLFGSLVIGFGCIHQQNHSQQWYNYYIHISETHGTMCLFKNIFKRYVYTYIHTLIWTPIIQTLANPNSRNDCSIRAIVNKSLFYNSIVAGQWVH